VLCALGLSDDANGKIEMRIWQEGSRRRVAASGIRPGDRIYSKIKNHISDSNMSNRQPLLI